MERIWKLLVANFIICMSVALLVVTEVYCRTGYSPVGMLMLLTSLAGILVGIVKGLWTIFN